MTEEDYDLFSKLKPQKYTRNNFNEYGFIAQDIYDAIDFSDNHQKCLLYNYQHYDENNPESPLLGVTPTLIIPLLVQAIQKNKADIIRLQKEIDSLK